MEGNIMSYEIIYNKQFLKTKEGKIIPLVLMGSNNVTEMTWKGTERRARDWNVCNMPHWCNYKIDFTPEELLKETEQWLDHEEMFKSNGRWINGKQWYNIVKRAIKNAKTIEELKPYERPRGYLSIWKGWDNTGTKSMIIETSDDLEKFIEFYYNRLENREENEKIYPKIIFNVERFEHQRRKPSNKPKEQLKEFYVVKINKDYLSAYVSQLTARNLRYVYNGKSGKQFKTEKQAEKWIQDRRIRERFGVECEIEKINID